MKSMEYNFGNHIRLLCGEAHYLLLVVVGELGSFEGSPINHLKVLRLIV